MTDRSVGSRRVRGDAPPQALVPAELPVRRRRLGLGRRVFTVGVTAMGAFLTLSLLPPVASAHAGAEVTFANGTKCGLSIQYVHYSRQYKDVSVHSEVLCNGSDFAAKFKTLLQGPVKNDHGPVIKVCDRTYQRSKRAGGNVYNTEFPCHSGNYPGDGLYYADTSVDVTVGNETKSMFHYQRNQVSRNNPIDDAS